MREQKISRRKREDLNDGEENFKAKLPASWFDPGEKGKGEETQQNGWENVQLTAYSGGMKV